MQQKNPELEMALFNAGAAVCRIKRERAKFMAIMQDVADELFALAGTKRSVELHELARRLEGALP